MTKSKDEKVEEEEVGQDGLPGIIVEEVEIELEPVVELEPEVKVQGKGKYYEDLFQGGK